MAKNNFFAEENIKRKLTNHAKNALAQSADLAKKRNRSQVENLDLFYAIFIEKGSMGSLILKDIGMKKNYFEKIFYVRKASKNNYVPSPAKTFRHSLMRAHSIARNLSSGYVGTEHILYAILESKDTEILKLMEKAKVKKPADILKLGYKKNPLQLFNELQNSHSFDYLDNLPEFESPQLTPVRNIATSKKYDTPYTKKFCSNINQLVQSKNESVIGREKEIARIINILGRKNKNNPLLIGYPGVGKTALVFGLAERINANQVPGFLLGKQIMSLDVASLVAGTSFRGEFEARLKEIIKEASENKDIILFIDEIHNIVGAGNISGSLDLANIIKPALSQGDMRLIGATTFSEYKKYIEKDAALERRFQTVSIREPSVIEAKNILSGIKSHYENFHNVIIGQEVVNLAVELSDRYIKNRYLPDKAIDVIDEAASEIRGRNTLSDLSIKIKKMEVEREKLILQKEKHILQENYEKSIQIRTMEKALEEKLKFLKASQQQIEKANRVKISPGDIFRNIARISGVSEEKLSQAKSDKVKNIAQTLSQHIINQKEAIRKITGVILRSQSGIGNAERPLGSFLFMGPTGVGKTLTAKVLAEEFFCDPEAFIRIDMSELMERHSIASLIGSPAGYVGYGEGGRLTEKVRRNPYSVVLFDEIEKAHPDIANILLQILEDGQLSDAEGTRVSFRNTLVIITTNIGNKGFGEAAEIGFNSNIKFPSDQKEKYEKIKEDALKELGLTIRPELLNRLDNIVVFNPLNRKDIEKITILELEKLAKRIKAQNIKLDISKKAITLISRKSLSERQGARLVRKNIQELLEDPIAEMIVYDKVSNGKIKVDIKKGKMKLI